MRTIPQRPSRTVQIVPIFKALQITAALTIRHVLRGEERNTVVVALVVRAAGLMTATLRNRIMTVSMAG